MLYHSGMWALKTVMDYSFGTQYKSDNPRSAPNFLSKIILLSIFYLHGKFTCITAQTFAMIYVAFPQLGR